MTKSLLPQPNKNAHETVELVGAILSSIPIAATLKELWAIKLKRDFTRAERILIDQIKINGLEVLSEEHLEFFVPASHKFFDQVRLGEYEHNLRYLAAIIAGALVEPTKEKPNIHQLSRALEGLTKFDLFVFCCCGLLQKAELANNSKVSDIIFDDFYISSGKLLTNYDSKNELSKVDIDQSLAILASKAILFPRGPYTLDNSDACYLVTNLGMELYDSVQSENRRQASSESRSDGKV